VSCGGKTFALVIVQKLPPHALDDLILEKLSGKETSKLLPLSV
jgi:hypothetical protein